MSDRANFAAPAAGGAPCGWIVGQGPPVLMLHRGPGFSHDYIPRTRCLDGAGNQVMQLHHLAPLPGRWTFEEYAADPVGGTSIAPTSTSRTATVTVGFYDPSLLGTGSGDSASSTFSASEVAPVEWEIDPSLVGPLAGPTSATATAGMIATSRTFDPSVSSSTGDAELSTLDRSAAAATPITIPPGGSAQLTATFTPTAADAGQVTGDLYVVDDVESAPAFNELADIPYSFRAG